MKFWIFSVLCLISVLLVGGCAEGSGGTVSYSSIFTAPYQLNVVNNTNLFVDLEVNGSLYKRNIPPGETLTIPFYQRTNQISIVAKFHDGEGNILGMDTWEISPRVRDVRKGPRNELLIMDDFRPVSQFYNPAEDAEHQRKIEEELEGSRGYKIQEEAEEECEDWE